MKKLTGTCSPNDNTSIHLRKIYGRKIKKANIDSLDRLILPQLSNLQNIYQNIVGRLFSIRELV